jgi:multiple sugar transport system ATP-binding protein
VAIGRAIVREPKVFLFDEPLSNLDAQLRHEMRSEIKRLHQRLGATIVYVTHDQVEAMTLADRIAVLSAGRLMQYGTPEVIYNRPAALFVAGFTGAPAMNLCDCTWRQDDGGRADLGGVRVAVSPELAARAAGTASLKLGVRPENIALAPVTADDQAVPAEVQLLEPLGAETLVTLRIGQAEMVARCPASFREPPGTALTVHLRAAHLHLFDAASGQAL